jgi:hypothetical protein
MSILHFALSLYFALVLGIAGIAKIDTPQIFATFLRSRFANDAWGTQALVRFAPWIELVLALVLLLVPENFRLPVTLVLSCLFLSFCVLHSGIFFTKPQKGRDCGCYGKAIKFEHFKTDAQVVLVQFLLTLVLVGLTLWVSPLLGAYFLVASALFLGLCGWLLFRTRQRYQNVADLMPVGGKTPQNFNVP